MIFKYIRNSNIFWVLSAFTPVIFFFSIFNEYAINIPFLDDFTFYSTISTFYGKSDFWTKIALFFAQHNEHRILLDRIVAIIIYFFEGHLDYRLMMLIGNLLLVGIVVVYFVIFFTLKLKFKYFVPIPFLVFHTQLFENSFWGMAAIQNYGVILLAYILFYLISTNKRLHFYLSFLVAFLAIYSSGNGVLCLIVTLILLLLQNRIKYFILFSIYTLILIGGYFYEYNSPSTKDYLDGIVVKDIIFGHFVFIGSIADIYNSSPLRYTFTAIVGLTLFIGALLIIFRLIIKSKLFSSTKSLNSTEIFLLGGVLFVFFTSIIVVVTRINYGMNSLLVSRYRLYSILFFINLYYYLLLYLNANVTNKLFYPLLLMAVCYNLISDFQSYNDVVSLNKARICGLANDIMAKKNDGLVGNILVYKKPPLWFDQSLSTFNKPINKAPIWEKDFSIHKFSDFLYSIENKTEDFTKKNYNVYLIMQSDQKKYIFPTNQRRNSLKTFLKTGHLWTRGFIGNFTRRQIDVGSYQLGLLIKEESKGQTYYLNDSLLIK
ncbi:hypothetical protein [Arcicella rosea]|uniref:Uncharacterized protein n=1 Tax=Arcicella rosea TaxID=502909 RepID=A0A841EQJ8_9BACT|nr:hypothetical protein [Arcicella rosea]MBB6004554.1 hypothetical protein [Arcicella rosea]